MVWVGDDGKEGEEEEEEQKYPKLFPSTGGDSSRSGLAQIYWSKGGVTGVYWRGVRGRWR